MRGEVMRFNDVEIIRKQVYIRIIIIKATGKINIQPKIQYIENVYRYAYLLYKLFKVF